MHITCLERSNLRHVKLTGARCWKANLSNANLTEAELTQADFDEANLSGSTMEAVKLGTFRVRGALTHGIVPKQAQESLAATAKEQQEEWDRRMNESPR